MKLKKSISILLIGIFLGGFCVGCSDNSGDNCSGSFDDDVKFGNNLGGSTSGGNIIVPTEVMVESFNPAFVGVNKVNLVTNILYTPMYIYEGGNITYGLASALEFKDNIELTIKLKEGLTWHDGKPITADDVVFTLELILDENQGSMLRKYLLVSNKQVSVVRIDDYTVKITLPEQKPGFLHNLSKMTPIPKHIYESEKNVSSSDKNNFPIGSGPFKFREIKYGEYIIFDKFDDYVGGNPKAESITIKVITKNNQKVLLEEGKISMMEATNELYKKSQEKNSKYQSYTHCAGVENFIWFNENTPIMKNINFRKAIAFALNRKALIRAAYGGEEDQAKEAKTILLPGTDFYYDGEGIESYEQDVHRAKEYLKASGINLRHIVIGYCSDENRHKEYAHEIKRQLEGIGFEVEVRAYIYKAFQDVLVKNNTECNLYVKAYELGLNPEAYKDYFESYGVLNQWGYGNEKIDELWENGIKEQDNEKRKKIYTDIQVILADELAVYPICYERTRMIALKSLRGIDNADPRGGGILFRDWSKLYIAK